MRGWIGGIAAISALFSAAYARAEAPATQPTTQPAISASNLFILERAEEKPNQHIVNLLERELYRQALLIAARDELGLYTRDEVLRETVPQDIGDITDRIATLRVDPDPKTGEIDLELDASGQTQQASQSRTSLVKYIADVAPEIAKAEELSREQFPDWLRASGFDGSAVEPSDAPAPDGIEQKLGDLSIIAQYDAVRSLHAAIRQNGQSPQLLGALVRGYANLGQITRFQWTAASDVFAARSLLYAQRMVVNDPGSAIALWHRAYAEAMAGLITSAREDLTAAATLAQTSNASKPAWVDLVDLLCHCDSKGLLKIAQSDPARAPLASYMAFMLDEHTGIEMIVMKTGKIAMHDNPNCERIGESMCEYANFGDLMNLVAQNFSTPLAAFPAELRQMSQVPADLADWQPTPDNPAVGVAAACQSLLQAPEAAEPSWSALGRLLQESNFCHVYRQAYFLAVLQGADPSEFLTQSAPLVKDHPYAILLNTLQAIYSGTPIPEAAKKLELRDPTFRMPRSVAYFWLLYKIKPGWADVWSDMIESVNPTAWDLELWLDYTPRGIGLEDWYYVQFAKALRKVSPDSAIGAEYYLLYVPNPDKHLPELLKQFSGQPPFDWGMSVRLMQQSKEAEAIPYLKRYIESVPSSEAYIQLAKCYLAQNDEPDWLYTLRDCLHQDIPMQDRADIDVQIARHYMDQGRYQAALPYAASAASDYGGDDAIHTFIQCEDALGYWDGAADWLSKSGYPFLWYCYCRTIGHGNLQAAAAADKEYLSSESEPDMYALMFDRGTGDAAKELQDLKHFCTEYPAITLGEMWLFTVYDAAGDSANRDAILKTIIHNEPNAVPNLGTSEPAADRIALAKLFQSALAKNPVELDMTAYNAIAQAETPRVAGRLNYFAGEFLLHHGHESEGLALLRDTMNHVEPMTVTWMLAGIELRKHGIDFTSAPTTR
jgi:hypothetical protein